MADYMTIEQVLELVPCVSRGNLATMRHDGRGPAFYKPTSRTVLYDKQSVLEWVQNSAVDMKERQERTAEYRAAKALEKEASR